MMFFLKFLIGPALIIALLGGGYAVVTTKAYNRGYDKGVSDTTEQMKKAIAKQKAETVKDIERLKTLPRSELEKELEKRCREAGGGDQCGN